MPALPRLELSQGPLALGVIGVLLLGFGTPRLFAAIAAAPVMADGVVRTAVDPGAVVRNAAALRRAGSGDALQRLGLAELAEADRGGRPGILAQTARHDLEAGLARAPAAPKAWSGLAKLELAAHDASGLASRAIVLSLLTGPNEPKLLWQRLDLSFALWPAIAASDRELVADQVQRAWASDPARLANLARRRDAVAPVRDALALEPGAVDRLNALLAAPPPSH